MTIGIFIFLKNIKICFFNRDVIKFVLRYTVKLNELIKQHIFESYQLRLLSDNNVVDFNTRVSIINIYILFFIILLNFVYKLNILNF